MLKILTVTPLTVLAFLGSANDCAQQIMSLGARDRLASDKRKTLADRLMSRMDAVQDEIGKFTGKKADLLGVIVPAMKELQASFESASKMLWTTPTSSADYRKAMSMFNLSNGHDLGADHSSDSRAQQPQRPGQGAGHG